MASMVSSADCFSDQGFNVHIRTVQKHIKSVYSQKFSSSVVSDLKLTISPQGARFPVFADSPAMKDLRELFHK